MTKSKQELYKNRPTSPHLSIYKPQISSILSIFHRISGICLFFSISFFSWWFILWRFSKFELCYLEYAKSIPFKALVFATSAAIFFHLYAGIRHLIWDSGRLLSIKAVNNTGWIAIIMTIISLIIFWACVI
jgi:succinate dehydrogenase / fumarate reductase cytochrome b subunit